MPDDNPRKVAVLDTSVQVDRQKMPIRERHLESILPTYNYVFSTGIALLEFKAVIIQECITIHNRLRQTNQFCATRDQLIESGHRQTRLRSHIFNNLIQVFVSQPGDITPIEDAQLAEKARLQLENVIPRLYTWFTDRSASSVIYEGADCTRAKEPPKKGRSAYKANLPLCKVGKNRNCRVEEFIREDGGPVLVQGIAALSEPSDQLARGSKVLTSVLEDKKKRLSHGDCRRAGDCLIALEGKRAGATHALSSNATEWSELCRILGLQFDRVTFT